MTRAEKARRIQTIFDALHPNPPIPLDHTDAFTLLVAVLMSAQTTDAQVNVVTPALFAAASSPQAMAQLSAKEILSKIRSCGLAPTKAKNIHALSGLLIERHAGEVPKNFEDLEALPGVGHKTASVVMAQAFGVAAFPVDTHIHRLATRWGLTGGRNVVQTEKDLKKVFPRKCWNTLHLQFIMFGRAQCPARGHSLEGCPICGWAASQRQIIKEKAEQKSRRERRAKPKGT